MSGYAGAAYASIEAYIESHTPRSGSAAWQMHGCQCIEATAIFRAVGESRYEFPDYRVFVSAGNTGYGGQATWKWFLTDDGKKRLRRRVEDFIRKTYNEKLLEVAYICGINL